VRQQLPTETMCARSWSTWPRMWPQKMPPCERTAECLKDGRSLSFSAAGPVNKTDITGPPVPTTCTGQSTVHAGSLTGGIPSSSISSTSLLPPVPIVTTRKLLMSPRLLSSAAIDISFEHMYDHVKNESGERMSAEPDQGWEPGDRRVVGPVDDCRWEGLADLNDMLRDDLGAEDPVRLQQMFDRDQAEYDAMTIGIEAIGSDGPPPTTPAEFADELINSGPDAAAAILDAMEPGPETATMIAMLRPAVLTPAAMVSVVSATEKLLSWVQARQHRWIAAFACPDVVASRQALKQYASQPGQRLHQSSRAGSTNLDSGVSGAVNNDISDTVSASAVFGDSTIDAVLTEVALNVAAAEIGAALHFTPMTSKRRVCQAVDFAIDLPATLTAMEAGQIDRGRAGVIAERTQNLPGELRRRVECSVLPKATSRTTGQVRGIVDRAVISVDPKAAKKRQQRAIAQRNVTYRAAEDGIGVFRAELGADKAQVAYSIIDQLADQLNRAPSENGEVDDRGIGALRADVFSDLFDQLACTGTITLHSTLIRRAAADAARGRIPETSLSKGSPTEPDEASGAHVDVASAAQFNSASGADSNPAPAAQSNSASGAESNQPSGVQSESSSGGDSNPPSGAEPNKEGGFGSTDSHRPADEDPAEFSEAVDYAPENAASEHLEEDGQADLAESSESGHRYTGPNEGSDGDPESVADLDRGPAAASGVDTSSVQDSGGNEEGRFNARGRSAANHPEVAGGTAENRRQLGTHHGRHTHLNVTIAESTLAGLDDRPGELEGHGPIPADLARAIAISAETIRAIAIRPGCGSALDIGRTSYRPRLAQRDHVTTRDQTCRFPGCRRAAKRCQIDHSDEFCPGRTDGGVTCPCNLCCLCAFHHGLKTGGLWDSVQHPDATITWTSPTGREYTTYPRNWPTEQDDRSIREPECEQCEANETDDEPPF